jgi:hypothetical protein
MTFKIVKNETAAPVAGIGTVAFEPMRRDSLRDRTHAQRFAFESGGREYWGEITRHFDRSAPSGRRVSYDVALMTRNARTGYGVAVAYNAKADWRRALVSTFKGNLERFIADAEAAAAEERATPADPVRLCLNCRVPADASPLCDDCAAVPSIAAEFLSDAAQPVAETPAADAARAQADSDIATGADVGRDAQARRDNVEWHAGRDARLAGLPVDANPFMISADPDSRRARWALGWAEAEGAEPDPAGASLPDLSDYRPAADPADSITDVETRREAGTVDLTPTWRGVAGIMILALENGTETGKAAAREEIRRACALADERNALAARVAQLEPLEAVATEANETAHCVPGMAGEALRGALRAAGWDCPEPDAPAAEVAAVAAVSTPVPWQRVADVICNGVEMGGSYIGWLHGFYKAAGGEGMQNAYAEGAFWQAGGVYRAHFDLPDGDEGEGAGRFLVAAEDITAGLETMARVCPSHFADLVAENDDIATADALLQCVILRADVESSGGLIYG